MMSVAHLCARFARTCGLDEGFRVFSVFIFSLFLKIEIGSAFITFREVG